MTTVSDERYERIRDRAREADPQQLATRMNLEGASESHKFECPFCASSDAFHVNPASRYKGGSGGFAARCYSCMGRGEALSDTIEMVERIQGVSHLEALEYITGEPVASGEASGVDSPGEASDTGEGDGAPAGSGSSDTGEGEPGDPLPPEAREERIAKLECDVRAALELLWREASLEGDDPATEYLRSRGISHNLAYRAGVRHVDATSWRYLVQNRVGYDLQHYAGLRDSNGNIHPARADDLILFPYFEAFTSPPDRETFALETLRFRAPDDGAPVLWLAGGEYDVCPSTPCTPFMAKDAVALAKRAGEPLYVCEGEIDCLSVWQCGRYAIGIPGATSWRSEWCEPWGALDVIVLLDGDDDGTGEDMGREMLRDYRSSHGTGGEGSIQLHLWQGGDTNDAVVSPDNRPLEERLASLEARL